MKYLVLILAIVLLAFPGISFSDFPLEYPEGMDYVVLEDPEVTTNINAWGWRDNAQVWVELKKTSGGYGTDVYVGKNHIEVVQDGDVYTGACLAWEKYDECGSFKMTPANANDEGRFFFRVDDDSSDDGSYGWDVKKAFEIYYKEDIDTFIYIDDAVTRELTIVSEPTDSGSVAGAGAYEVGEAVGLSASPATGYQFSHWDSDTSDKESEKTYNMPTEDVTIVAHFVPRSGSDSSDNVFDSGCFLNVCDK